MMKLNPFKKSVDGKLLRFAQAFLKLDDETFFEKFLIIKYKISRMAELSLEPLRRMIRAAGAERVSDEAAKALREILEEEGERIASRAIKLAKHTGRKTVKAEDIKLARK